MSAVDQSELTPTRAEESRDGPISPLLVSESGSDNEFNGMTRSQAFNLYTSHFLSTWNVRTYEFAAIIFTAAAYPDTLVAASIRGVVRTLASICFSSTVGRWVDNAPSRLKTLLSTISVNRISVVSASVFWFFISRSRNGQREGTLQISGSDDIPISSILKGAMFTVILALGVLEGLSAGGNMMSMERDWVVTAAAPDGQPYDLTQLNSVMRRIDLICKLIAPILISVIISATDVKIGVLVVGSMSAASWAVELWCAKRVWDLNPRLKAPKILGDQETSGLSTGTLSIVESRPRTFLNTAFTGVSRYVQDFKNYFSSMVWTPSLALALLHISALTYSATFITYLLTVGFSLELITVARAAGSVVEISSTIVTPFGVQYLSKAQIHGRYCGQDRNCQDSTTALLEGAGHQEDGRTETGLERLGLWGLSWQLFNLVPVVFALWSLSPGTIPASLPPLVSRILHPMTSQPLLAFILFFFLSISRLGLWIYDLTTQQLTQTMTSPSQRSSFTGVEYSFVSLFELGHHIITIMLHRPEQFKWIALISWCAVAVSTAAYAAWVWRMRGHLVHWERIGKGCECINVRLGRDTRVTSWRRRLGHTLSLRPGRQLP